MNFEIGEIAICIDYSSSHGQECEVRGFGWETGMYDIETGLPAKDGFSYCVCFAGDPSDQYLYFYEIRKRHQPPDWNNLATPRDLPVKEVA